MLTCPKLLVGESATTKALPVLVPIAAAVVGATSTVKLLMLIRRHGRANVVSLVIFLAANVVGRGDIVALETTPVLDTDTLVRAAVAADGEAFRCRPRDGVAGVDPIGFAIASEGERGAVCDRVAFSVTGRAGASVATVDVGLCS
jgi:hypothetical protein